MSVFGNATLVVPMDWAVLPSGKQTMRGDTVGTIVRVAMVASECRIKILSEPVSAQEVGVFVSIVNCVEATGVGKLRDCLAVLLLRLVKEGFLLLLLFNPNVFFPSP